MNRRLRGDLKWLLILPVLVASLAAAMVALEFSIILDRPFIARAFTLGINSSPPSLLRPLHLLVMLGIALILVLPSALSVAFAGSVRPRVCLAWGFSIASLLTSAFVWFTAPGSNPPGTRWAAGVAVAIVVGGIVLAQFGSQRYRIHALATVLGIVALFIPSLAALAHPKKYPPEPQKVWSAVLQEEIWQGMNTGSEYAATRQVLVAGDRVLAVFDAGSAGYEENWPLSNYRLLSLDIATGTKKNEIDFPGRWGSMPYIYSAENSQIDVQSNPPRRLNPDLSPVREAVSTAAAKTSGTEAATLKTPGTCEFNPQIPMTLPSWQFGCSTIRMVDSEGRPLSEQPVVDGFGGFAGESRDGSRFALVSSESEGDPSFLLYEHFTIYDGNTANAIAMVPIKNLPERQSWSAFSADGKYFVVGNPNNLSLYRLP